MQGRGSLIRPIRIAVADCPSADAVDHTQSTFEQLGSNARVVPWPQFLVAKPQFAWLRPISASRHRRIHTGCALLSIALSVGATAVVFTAVFEILSPEGTMSTCEARRLRADGHYKHLCGGTRQ